MDWPPCRVIAVLLAAAVVLAGCSGGASRDDEERTTVPTAAPTSTTTPTAVSYEIPPVIDAAYIEKVMAALDHIEGSAVRRALAQRRLDEEFVGTLAAIYMPEAADLTQQVWLAVAGGNFEMLAPEPADPVTTVERVVLANESCIVVVAKRDFSAAFERPDPPDPGHYIALVRLPADRNPGGRNPTPWTINFDGDFEDQREPRPEEVCTPRNAVG